MTSTTAPPPSQSAARDAGIWHLRGIHLLADLSPQELRRLGRMLRPATYRRGEYLFHMGDRADRLYFLHKGAVKVSILSQSGKERILEIFRPGDIFGELFLAAGARRLYTAQALTPVRAYTVTGEAFRRLMRARPDLSQTFINYLVHQQRRALLRLQALLALAAGPRILATLLDMGERITGAAPTPTWRLALSQDELARMNGLHRSTVSTWINTYRRSGVLGGRGKLIVIHRGRAKKVLLRAGFPLP